MKRVLYGLAGLAVWAAIVPQNAHALVPAVPTSGCAGPTGLTVCASISAVATNVGTGHWQLQVTVANLFPSLGDSHSIIAVGVGSTVNVTSFSLLSATIDGSIDAHVAGGWAETNDAPPNGNAVGGLLSAVFAQSGNDYGVGGGHTIVLVFDYWGDGEINSQSITSLGWHSAAVNQTTCSLWANTQGTYVGTNLDTCTSTVPEPVTMVLLGTGLAGIGALRRRRRGLDVENA